MFPYFTQNNSFNPHQNLSEADYYFLSSCNRRGNRLRRIKSQDFPGGPVAKILHSQCKGKTIPGRGTRSHARVTTEGLHATTKDITSLN